MLWRGESSVTWDSQKYLGRPLKNEKGAAKALLDDLEIAQHVSPIERVELDDVWKVRNKAVHPKEQPEENEIESMIEKIEKICLG